MLRNKIGPSFASKNGVFFVFFFARFSLKSHSPCRKKKIFEKQKRKKRENLDQVLTRKKAIFGPSFDFTANTYTPNIGRTPKEAYSSRGCSRHLLETAFSEPLLRTLLRTLFYCKTHSRPPSQNPSANPFPRTLPRTFSEPFLERNVLPYDPLGVHPKIIVENVP